MATWRRVPTAVQVAASVRQAAKVDTHTTHEFPVPGEHPARRRAVASGSVGAWLLVAAGAVGAALAAATDAPAARSAASQDWPPFVLVTGLLLIGLAADDDQLFAAAGGRFARLAGGGAVLYAGAVVLVSVVTALLNLDTSVAFLTPVLVHTARRRGSGEAPLLYGCLLLSNAGSLLLPGSNLTNLIVLGHLHLSGAAFLSRMVPAWAVAVVVTAIVVAIAERRSLRPGLPVLGDEVKPVIGLGLVAVVAAAALVLLLRSPALPVAAVGVAVSAVRLARRRESLEHILAVLGLPAATAGLAAVTAVLVNNLPAASLLAARVPQHPFSMLVGLNLGANLFVTGSLAWALWLRTARVAGATPSIRHASRLGVLVVPASMAAALGALVATGWH
jgi:arsenical pump membrane protein